MTKRGLGKGLGALFSDFDEVEDFVSITKDGSIKKNSDTTAIEVDIKLIDRNTKQPRKRFDEKSISELAQSIKTHGVIQPIILTTRGQRYLIVAGERRWRASKEAGLSTIPAIIRDYSDRDIAEISIIENLQREDLNPIESARAIRELIEKFDMTQESVADKIGKSRPAVANTLRLLTLPDKILDMVENYRLSAGHARALVSVNDRQLQQKLAEMSCDNKITVRELEKYIKQAHNPTQTIHKAPNLSLEIKNFVKQMQDKFATKVSITGNENKGKISIAYYNKDDLERIYSIINKM